MWLQGLLPWSSGELAGESGDHNMGGSHAQDSVPGRSANPPARRQLSGALGTEGEAELPDWARSMTASQQTAVPLNAKDHHGAHEPELIDFGSWDDAPAAPAAVAMASGGVAEGAFAGGWSREQAVQTPGNTGNPFAGSLGQQLQPPTVGPQRAQSGNPFAEDTDRRSSSAGQPTIANAADEDFMDRLLDL